MNWSEFLNIVLKIFVFPVIGICLTQLVNFIKIKSNELITKTESEVLQKYIRMANETVAACVVATNQTFVDALKEQGKFDKEAQLEAFEKTKKAVLAILTDDAIVYLTNAVGDIDTYLTQLIEAQVKVNKTVLSHPMPPYVTGVATAGEIEPKDDDFVTTDEDPDVLKIITDSPDNIANE